ncbi:MAG: 50S ribosomal protein L9 [Puniceicoccales bacterium]|jgi:large subunit ribosomal protein L9|nr:50S ribosomal protein L9 [Puniceicoccales bacterium]
MAIAEILLLRKVNHVGDEGDRVVVRAGYARNYLLPKKLAIPVTRSNRKQIEALRLRREEREARELQEAQALAEKIRTFSMTFSVKTGEKGKMFGAITASDLERKFAEAGMIIDRKKIQLDPVKRIGQSTAKIKLHPSVIVDCVFDVCVEGSLV